MLLLVVGRERRLRRGKERRVTRGRIGLLGVGRSRSWGLGFVRSGCLLGCTRMVKSSVPLSIL